MPLAMSNANFTAWLWSTTRAEEEQEGDSGEKERRGQERGEDRCLIVLNSELSRVQVELH